MKNPKLYIWTNFCVDYSPGLAFAIAKDEKTARKMIIKELGFSLHPSDWGDLEVRDVNTAVSRSVSGGG